MSNNYSDQLSLQEPVVSDDVKRLFAFTETSGDITGDWLQLEPGTFKDLQMRKKIPRDIKMQDLQNPELYDKVAKAYITDLQTTFGIPTVQEAALWSWRPGWYKKYKGDISRIPADKSGVRGKTAKQVMIDRTHNLQSGMQAGKEVVDGSNR